MLKKLRLKFILFTMGLVLVMLCIIFGTVYGFTARSLKTDSLNLMYTISARPAMLSDSNPTLGTPYLVLQQTLMGSWVAQGSDYYDLSDQTFLGDLLQEVTATEDRSGILPEYDMRYLRAEGPTVRYIFLDISAERTTLRHLAWICTMIGVVSLLLFFGISLLLADLAVRPVEKAWLQQKQFVADASHELKTPLAVIMTNAELLQEPGYPEEEHRQFEANILTKAQQMRHLVEGLLELTRLDNVVPTLQPMDLSAATEHALLPFEPVFFENAMLLESSIAPGLWVKGSPSHLQQVTEIFLDNALKYGSAGPVTVTLQQAGVYALLQVETLGQPLSAEDAKKIFLRFYRQDPARTAGGSYGLGLSIAQKIVQQHGGRIWAEGTPTGNRFSVLLPLA